MENYKIHKNLERYKGHILDVLHSFYCSEKHPSEKESDVISKAADMVIYGRKRRWVFFTKIITPEEFESEVCRLFEEHGMETFSRDFKMEMVSEPKFKVYVNPNI